MLFIQAFLAFIFIKIADAFMFGGNLTIIAAALIAITSALALFIAQTASAIGVLKWAARRLETTPYADPAMNIGRHTPIGPTFLPYLLAMVAATAAALGIVLGFSERLADDLFDSYYRSELFWFCVLVLIPMVAHYLVSLSMLARAAAAVDSHD